MFNGIIINTGKIVKIIKKENDCILTIKSKMKFKKNEIGSSISCSGTCLTLERFNHSISQYYVSSETLKRTNFSKLKKDDIINLEKSIKFGDRISGHFIQGHIDTTCSIKKIKILGKSCLIDFKMSQKYKKLIVEKGSIAINGVSLTVSRILKNGFQIAVIPKTLELTNLLSLNKNDLVNIEFDLLGKYIKKLIK